MVSSQLEGTQEEAWVVIMGRKSRAKQIRKAGTVPAFHNDDVLTMRLVLAGSTVMTKLGINMKNMQSFKPIMRNDIDALEIEFRVPHSLQLEGGYLEQIERAFGWFIIPPHAGFPASFCIHEYEDFGTAKQEFLAELGKVLMLTGAKISMMEVNA